MAEFTSEIVFKNESILNENSNLDWQFEDPLYSNDTEKKCGEIILLAKTKFWFVCTFCGERFHSILIFGNHIKDTHILDSENVKDENPLNLYPNEHLVIKFETDVKNGNCNAGERSEETLEEHKFDGDKELGNSSKNQYEIGEIHEDIQSFSKPVNDYVRGIRKNKVSICENIADLTPAKKAPKKRNRKKKIYSCPTCQHIARDKKSLEAHLQSNHGTGTRHQCEECGKCFRNGNNLKSHLIIHSGTRPYKCDSCDSDFSHYNSLKTHRYIHTGERPHKCNECDKGFVSSSGLKTHMQKHTGEIPYVCQFCERGFAKKCSYKRHMISHSGQRAYGCQQCKKTFIHKETLTNHMACHSNEKKFVCDICSKKFNHKKNLVEHQKLHLNTKQYICKICSKEFAQYAGLYSHMKYHK